MTRLYALALTLLIGLLCIGQSCKNEASAPPPALVEIPNDRTHIHAAADAITIDGRTDDKAWTGLDWKPLDQVWLGKAPDSLDFKGRYKVCYDAGFIYVLAEITDDSLTDTHPNGLDRYWDDDCLEVFMDEDGSGGNHQYNYNAFAYHLSLDGRSVDVAPDSSFQYFDDHVVYKRVTEGRTSTWECAFRVYKDNYINKEESVPLALRPGKQMGFMLAYCDNDKSPERENFIGSTPISGDDKNRGWIDAGVFEKVVLGY
jgi:hypothetical protein